MSDEEKDEDGFVIKILNIEDTEHNPIWSGLGQLLNGLAFVIVVCGLALSVKMCKTDLETISRAWHGQLEPVCEDKNE